VVPVDEAGYLAVYPVVEPPAPSVTYPPVPPPLPPAEPASIVYPVPVFCTPRVQALLPCSNCSPRAYIDVFQLYTHLL